jgi:hypothetical protein
MFEAFMSFHRAIQEQICSVDRNRLIQCVVLVESRTKRRKKSRGSRRHDDGTPAGRFRRGRSCHGRRSSRQPQLQS